MLDVFNIPTVQGGTNYQEFYGGGTRRDWVKPRGASMVRFMLIGPGGGGSSGTSGLGGGGGGSGAITQWIGPAIFIPDILRITVGAGGLPNTSGSTPSTTVIYQQKDGTGYTLLEAQGGGNTADQNGASAAGATSNNFFGASGIYFNVAGVAGRNAGSGSFRPSTSFLIGGAGGAATGTNNGGLVEGIWGYKDLAGGLGTNGGDGNNGYFITQPFFLSYGGSGGGGKTGSFSGGTGGRGGVGCGGGGGGLGPAGGVGGRGGDGAVFVWAW
jgi:hypothetical protein